MADHLNEVMLIAAFTARSQAYTQALAREDMRPGIVVTLGTEKPLAPTGNAITHWQGIDLHDPSKSILQVCADAHWRVENCPVDNINAPEVAAMLAAHRPRLVIYSGYGGQIVGDELLALGIPFLHLHTGWLPSYRGSTTLYYALLKGDPPAASALILDKRIDTGPLVARRTYPRPPAGMDIDSGYDSALRADLLIRVLRDYASTEELPIIAQQDTTTDSPYFVIHPVLKHLAMLSLESQ
jgi:methionyl-tRNA formyltransferase